MRVTPGAIPLLEEAVHVLRRAPLATLVCHLLGTTPFALALLLFWNDVNNPHTSDTAVARESLVLALLLVWMNCWRAVFAGRLRRQLSASADTPWTWRRTWNLIAGQAFLGATKLVVMPLAALTVFGFAWTVAFYRSATALADRRDLDPVQLIAQRAAPRRPRSPSELAHTAHRRLPRPALYPQPGAHPGDASPAHPGAHRLRIAIQPQRPLLHFHAAVFVGHAGRFLDDFRPLHASSLLPAQFLRRIHHHRRRHPRGRAHAHRRAGHPVGAGSHPRLCRRASAAIATVGPPGHAVHRVRLAVARSGRRQTAGYSLAGARDRPPHRRPEIHRPRHRQSHRRLLRLAAQAVRGGRCSARRRASHQTACTGASTF